MITDHFSPSFAFKFNYLNDNSSLKQCLKTEALNP